MRVGPPRTERERIAAVQCLFGSAGTSPAVPCSEADCDPHLRGWEPDGLIAAWSNGRPLAATMVHVATGGTAYLWAPEIETGEGPADVLAAVLLHEATTRLDAAECPLTLCVIRPDRLDQHQALVAAGFASIGPITTWQHSLVEELPAVPERSPSRVPFGPAVESRFSALIERTFEDSGDCPRRLVRQSGRALLDSYAGSFGSRTDRWSMFVRDGRDIAVLLANDHLDDDSRELAYLGVVPEMRRQGIARDLVARLLHDASANGCMRVITTARDGNAPAVSLYRKLGFVAIDRNVGYVRSSETTDGFGDRTEGAGLH